MHINNENKLLLDFIQKEYSIKDINSIENYKLGFLSDSFIVGSKNDKYFLKKYRSRHKDALDLITKASLYFSKHSIPVIMPIKNSRDEYDFEFQSNKYSLFPFVKDIICKSRLTNHELESAGKMLAKIHLAGKQCSLENSKRTTQSVEKEFTLERINKVVEVLNAKVHKNETDRKFMQMIDLYKMMINKYDFDMEKLGLISDHLTHGDYHLRNISFDESGNVNHIFDLKCLISSRFLELARSISLICFDTTNCFCDNNFEKTKHYLAGYKSVYPLTKKGLRAGLMGYFIKNFHSIWMEEEYYLKNNKTVADLLDRSLYKTKYTSKHFDKIAEKITNLI